VASKIREFEERATSGAAREQHDNNVLPPKVVLVYTKVGELLSRYRSGKLPKALKMLPRLRNWHEILYLTQPDQWTPNATYEVTRMFISNLQPVEARRFCEDFLLPQIREEIHATKKLNVHLYGALKKSLYKPMAFNKGILFPLCDSGNCTLREATIVASVIVKVSIPVLHSGAALHRLCESTEVYNGANSIFIKALLSKKHALPFRVVDAAVFHFLRFRSYDKPLPVLWHQALLAFAQHYRNDIVDEQREALLELIKVKSHEQITPEIRRELQQGVSRMEDVSVKAM